LLLDTTAKIVNGQVYAPDGTAIILDDGRVYTQDNFAYLDQTTGNVLTILDPLHETNYSVVTDVITKNGKFYTVDKESYPVKVGDNYVAYTLDYFAYVDP
jgi:hypothetical protein